MSKQAAVEFWMKVLQDEDLGRDLQRQIANLEPEKIAPLLVAAGARNGLAFDGPELAEAQKQVQAVLAGEMGEEELGAIAGGITLNLLTMAPILKPGSLATVQMPTTGGPG